MKNANELFSPKQLWLISDTSRKWELKPIPKDGSVCDCELSGECIEGKYEKAYNSENNWISPTAYEEYIVKDALRLRNEIRTRPGYRKLNNSEKEILDTLLANYFPGRDEIKIQLSRAIVRPSICECRCLSVEFYTASNILAPTDEYVPVEAEYYLDENPYQVLLHVRNGKVTELEFVSYEDKSANKYPKASELKVVINKNKVKDKQNFFLQKIRSMANRIEKSLYTPIV